MSFGAGSGCADAVIFAGIEPFAAVVILISYRAPLGTPLNVCTSEELFPDGTVTFETLSKTISRIRIYIWGK